MQKLTVQEVDIDSLIPYSNNAKIHTKEQLKQIKKSILDFGFNDPVAIWGDEIVEGHGRVLASKELGLKTIPAIRLDHLTDEQRRAYTHVHNQLTMNTSIDFDILADDFAELDFNFAEFGFDMEEILPSMEDFGVEFEMPDDDAPKVKSVSLMLSAEQFELVDEIIQAFGDIKGEGNRAGNVVAEVFREWQELKILK